MLLLHEIKLFGSKWFYQSFPHAALIFSGFCIFHLALII